MNKILIAAIAMPLSGCAIQQSQKAMEAKDALVGASKEAILQCMGAPLTSRTEGSTEVWTYGAGGGSAGLMTGNVVGVVNYNCTANVIMTNGVVSRINYSGRTGGLLTEGKACYQLVENCGK